MTDAAENFDDQLLSAYIDGELSGESLAQVEQRLAADPAARQLVAELRELSATLQSLPRETVGDRLREVVFEKTETVGPATEVYSRHKWAWATLAVAAALLLALYLPDDDRQERSVAMVDHSKPGREAKPAPSFSEAAPAEGFLSDSMSGEFGESDDQDPSLVVHLTLNNESHGGEPFDLLLTKNRILLDRANTKSRNARKRSKRSPAKRDLVLVEASAEQIGQVLQEANSDHQNYQEVRLDTPIPVPPPVALWRQWERSVTQHRQLQKPFSARAAEQSAQHANRHSNVGARARRVDADWYRLRNQSIERLESGGRYQFGRNRRAEPPTADPQGLNTATISTDQSMRVLFILHPPQSDNASPDSTSEQ